MLGPQQLNDSDKHKMNEQKLLQDNPPPLNAISEKELLLKPMPSFLPPPPEGRSKVTGPINTDKPESASALDNLKKIAGIDGHNSVKSGMLFDCPLFEGHF